MTGWSGCRLNGVRADIVAHLRAAGPATVDELATALARKPTVIYSCLSNLAGSAYVRLTDESYRGKRRYALDKAARC